MLWKLNGKTMKTPSSYKDNIEDLDNDSYTSKVTGALIDNVVATRNVKTRNELGLSNGNRSRGIITSNIPKSNDDNSEMSKCKWWYDYCSFSCI